MNAFSQKFRLIAVSVALLAGIWLYVFYDLREQENATIAAAERESQQLAHAYAENIRGIVKLADLVLVEMARDWEEHTHQTGDFEREFDRFKRQIEDISVQTAVADGEGWMLFSSAMRPPYPDINLAEREHFQVHVDTAESRLFIGKPVVGKASRKWSIQLSRPILKRGQFSGIVVFSINPEALGSFYHLLSLDPQDVVSVVRNDGTVLSRQPNWERFIGQVVLDAPYKRVDAPDAGAYRRTSQIDGIDRIFGYYRLPDYNLTTVVGISLEQKMLVVRQQSRLEFGIAVLLSLMTVLLTVLLYRWMKKRDSLVAETSAQNALLEAQVAERTQVLLQANKELALAASVFHNTQEGILITDADAHIVSVNPAFSDITGYSATEAISQKPSILRSEHHDASFYQTMWASLTTDGSWRGEIWNRRKDGEAFLESLTINRIDNADGTVEGYVAVFRDITELHIKDQNIRHMAFHDALTGLPNRMLLQDRLEQAILRAVREASWIAVAFIDLDRFKSVNDRLGHEFGDRLLQEAAERIRLCLRNSDSVARLGGDEFIALLEDLKTAADASHVAAKTVAEISRPFEIDGQVVEIGASIGIALYPDHGGTGDALLKHADIAMYAAKSAGRSTFRFFEPAMCEEFSRTQ